MSSCRIALISTGGTIEKTYDELRGVLANQVSVLDVLLGQLELADIVIERTRLMNLDSLEMTAADHERIATTAIEAARGADGVVVVHGTDRLAHTGEAIAARAPRPDTAIVLTGAMRPFVMRTTDAVQNVTEALLACRLLPPGTYVAMHGRVHGFPGARKDPTRGTFVGGSAVDVRARPGPGGSPGAAGPATARE